MTTSITPWIPCFSKIAATEPRFFMVREWYTTIVGAFLVGIVVRPSRPHMQAGRLRYKVFRIIVVYAFRPHMQAGRLRYKVFRIIVVYASRV